MRVVVLGIGAIGGTLAATLARAGTEVVGIARGPQYEAIRAKGLLLRTPDFSETVRFDVVERPDALRFGPKDVVVLATKTQHSLAALEDLRAAGLRDQPVFCAQNGVENERLALRLFPNVHGVMTVMPCDYVTPGEVVAFGTPKHGILELGRFPSGADVADRDFAALLGRAGYATFVAEDVMAGKYGKLLTNLGNMGDAAFGGQEGQARVNAAAKAEGRAVLKAAGIAWRDVGDDDPRRAEFLKMKAIEGVTRAGSSSTQSLLRGTGSIETDYLNGEIALLGRLYGVATPVNDWFVALAAQMLRDGTKPGTVSPDPAVNPALAHLL